MPTKHPDFIIHEETILNGGMPPAALIQSFITPTEQFFVRSHAPIPMIDPAGYRLQLDGLLAQPISYTLDELQARFEPVTLTVTLQCAGNRRLEMAAHAPIDDQLSWGAEAIGTAEWGGVRLADVLRAAGVDEQASLYVEFMGLDEGTGHGCYGGSITLEKALTPDVLLVYAMNGRPLPPEHGYPLRALVPGYIGARSVKWLGRVRVQPTHSDNYFQQVGYKLYPPYVDADTATPADGMMLSELSVNTAICSPAEGAHISGRLRVRGYAMSERPVTRVDVGVVTDSGVVWRAAVLSPDSERWTWRLWEADFDLPPGDHEIVARAWNTASNTQPENVADIWNFKGYMNNAWARLRVRVG